MYLLIRKWNQCVTPGPVESQWEVVASQCKTSRVAVLFAAQTSCQASHSFCLRWASCDSSCSCAAQVHCTARSSQTGRSLAFLEEKDASAWLCAFTVKLYVQLRTIFFFLKLSIFGSFSLVLSFFGWCLYRPVCINPNHPSVLQSLWYNDALCCPLHCVFSMQFFSK